VLASSAPRASALSTAAIMAAAIDRSECCAVTFILQEPALSGSGLRRIFKCSVETLDPEPDDVEAASRPSLCESIAFSSNGTHRCELLGRGCARPHLADELPKRVPYPL